MSTNWKEWAKDRTFTVEVDGASFLCGKPSGTQLVAKGVLPPAIVMGRIDPAQARMNGDRNRVLLDEKAQDALLDAVLIKPRIWDGEFDACPEDAVPRRALASVRDVLVVTILAQLYDVDIVRGAAFRGQVTDGGDDGADRKAKRDAHHGRDGASGRKARVRNRVVAGG